MIVYLIEVTYRTSNHEYIYTDSVYSSLYKAQESFRQTIKEQKEKNDDKIKHIIETEKQLIIQTEKTEQVYNIIQQMVL